MKRPFPSLAFPFRSMFVFFLVIDLGFIGLNVAASALGKLHLVGPLPAFLMVTEDLGIPEFFNYFKWALIAVPGDQAPSLALGVLLWRRACLRRRRMLRM